MNNINQLHADFLKAQDNRSQEQLKIKEKTDELNGVKQTISDLNEKLTKVNHLLSNANKGVGDPLSSEKFVSLKKESNEGKETLTELNEFLILQNNILSSMISNTRCRSNLKMVVEKITEELAEQYANNIKHAAFDDLKAFMHTTLTQQDLNLSNKSFYDVFYYQIGKRLCKHVFTSDDGSVELPTIEKSYPERDILIENIA